jgi:hypothetical protein
LKPGALVHLLLVEPKKLDEVNYTKFIQPGLDVFAPVLEHVGRYLFQKPKQNIFVIFSTTMSGFSSIDQLTSMATIESPFAHINNNQSLVGTTTYNDVEEDRFAMIPTPTVPEVEVIINAASHMVHNEYQNIQWEDCDFNEDGDPIGVDGKTWKQIHVAKLHKICSKLQVYGVKNAKKDNIIESIINTYKNSILYITLKSTMDGDNKENDNQPQPSAPRKEQQCPYRLMNILFSDDYAEEFGTTANTPNRSTLDAGKLLTSRGFGKK